MQMHLLRQLVGEVFDAAIAVASEKDADLRYNEVRGAFLPIKEDTWQEVCPTRLAVCSAHNAQALLHSHSRLKQSFQFTLTGRYEECNPVVFIPVMQRCNLPHNVEGAMPDSLHV